MSADLQRRLQDLIKVNPYGGYVSTDTLKEVLAQFTTLQSDLSAANATIDAIGHESQKRLHKIREQEAELALTKDYANNCRDALERTEGYLLTARTELTALRAKIKEAHADKDCVCALCAFHEHSILPATQEE